MKIFFIFTFKISSPLYHPRINNLYNYILHKRYPQKWEPKPKSKRLNWTKLLILMSLMKSPAPILIFLEREVQVITQPTNSELRLKIQEKWEYMKETKEKEGKLFHKRIFLILSLDFSKTESLLRSVVSRRRPNTASWNMTLTSYKKKISP